MQLRVAVLRQSAIGDEIFLRPTHAIIILKKLSFLNLISVSQKQNNFEHENSEVFAPIK